MQAIEDAKALEIAKSVKEEKERFAEEEKASAHKISSIRQKPSSKLSKN